MFLFRIIYVLKCFFLAVFSDLTYTHTPGIGRKRLLHLSATVPFYSPILYVFFYVNCNGSHIVTVLAELALTG